MPNIDVGSIQDVAEGATVAAEAGGHKLVLTRVGGEIYAMARKCPHLGADLCGGRISGGAIVCPRHGAAFDIATGQPIGPAKVLFLKMTPKPLASYPVAIAGDRILVAV